MKTPRIIFVSLDLKDYYTILGLPPSASSDEIKKAYRLLALQFHPDKTGSNPYASAKFTLIKEAYETLTHPLKKEHYLQQRWYAQSAMQRSSIEPDTPVTILKKLLELDRYVSKLDIHRMNAHALTSYIQEILSPDCIVMLNSFQDPSVNTEIIDRTLAIASNLPYSNFLSLTSLLSTISANKSAASKINRDLQKRRQQQQWEKIKPALLFLIAIMLCLIIFLLSK